MSAGEWWDALGGPWQAAFEEAWASWRAGSLGIGAVVVGPAGELVARGRNRLLDQRTDVGVLADTPLAHAEVNTLGQLPLGPLDGHRLLTTLEPCVMCASAVLMARMPVVEFAAADPLFDGLHDVLDVHPFAADRVPERIGPWTGPGGAFASMLPLSALAFWQPDGIAVQAHRVVVPWLVEALEAVLADGRLAEVARADGTVLDAADAVWPLLTEQS